MFEAFYKKKYTCKPIHAHTGIKMTYDHLMLDTNANC